MKDCAYKSPRHMLRLGRQEDEVKNQDTEDMADTRTNIDKAPLLNIVPTLGMYNDFNVKFTLRIFFYELVEYVISF